MNADMKAASFVHHNTRRYKNESQRTEKGNDMIDKAIAKLTEEMMELNNPFAQAMEEHLTQLCTNDRIAEKILQEGKSLKAACEKVREKAKKEAVRGIGIVSDQDAYKMVEEYFGITEVAEKRSTEKKINVLDLI